MSNNDIAVQIKDLRKQYRLGVIGGGTLKGDLQSWWARIRGKEDPNLKIGTKIYKKNEKFMALDGINLTIKKGERLGIIGRNGAGKSTLLKILSRVTAPTEGEIGVNGRISSMLEVGTGFNPELTGRENIYLNGAILGMTRDEVSKKIDNIIEFSECSQFIDTPVKRYSSGMYVKLAFAVAAHLDSEIMIMDEVLAVGDMAFQQKCLDKMSDVSETEGKTILYVSHNMTTIRKLCDRCIVIDEGKIIFDGDVDRAIEIYLFEQSDTSKTDYLYTNKHRNLNWSDLNFKIEELHLVNPKTFDVPRNGTFEVEIVLKSEIRVQNVQFRFEFSTSSGQKSATIITDKMIDFEESETKRITVELDTSYITPGRYRVDLVGFFTGAMGKDNYLDGVYPAFTLEILEDEKIIMQWLKTNWSAIRLKDAEVKKIN